MDHEQIIANESIQKIEYSGFGEVRQPRSAAKFDQTPAQIQGPAPRLGENSREILSELGYWSDKIESLMSEKKILVSD